MGEHIEKTGIRPGQITSGEVSLESAIESLCVVVDHEVVPAIHTLCRTQKLHAVELNDLKDEDAKQKADISKLDERSEWTKAIILLGLASTVTAIFTLIVAVVIPAVGG